MENSVEVRKLSEGLFEFRLQREYDELNNRFVAD